MSKQTAEVFDDALFPFLVVVLLVMVRAYTGESCTSFDDVMPVLPSIRCLYPSLYIYESSPEMGCLSSPFLSFAILDSLFKFA